MYTAEEVENWRRKLTKISEAWEKLAGYPKQTGGEKKD
jgi:hypothetical protein